MINYVVLFQSLWIFSLINYTPPTYRNGRYIYPGWAHGIGWTIAAVSLACVPAYALFNLIRAPGSTFLEVRKYLKYSYINNFLNFYSKFRNSGSQLNQIFTNVKYVENIIVNMIFPKRLQN